MYNAEELDIMLLSRCVRRGRRIVSKVYSLSNTCAKYVHTHCAYIF
jgi:hypothetical protein